MLELTLRGNCPHCGKALNASAVANSDVVPPELPDGQLGTVVAFRGHRYVIIGQCADLASGSAEIRYELTGLEKGQC